VIKILGRNKEHPKKGPKKDKPSLSAMNPSHSLSKIKLKVDIKSYHKNVGALNLNFLLQQMEVYFIVHHIEEEQNILFVQLKLEGHALTLWENHKETLRL